MDATHRQRILRAATLMLVGTVAGLAASLDPIRALTDWRFVTMALAMLVWTVAENIALQQDEPPSYHGKRNTRMLQGAMMLGIAVGVVDLFHLPLAHPVWLSAIGLVLLAAGALVRIVAIRTLDRHFRYELRVEAGQGLVRSGVYARVRHPSYLGLALIALGAPLILASALGGLVALALLLPLLARRIADEERVLEAGFGAEYGAYRDASWRLVPFVY